MRGFPCHLKTRILASFVFFPSIRMFLRARKLASPSEMYLSRYMSFLLRMNELQRRIITRLSRPQFVAYTFSNLPSVVICDLAMDELYRLVAPFVTKAQGSHHVCAVPGETLPSPGPDGTRRTRTTLARDASNTSWASGPRGESERGHGPDRNT